jgi:hypothetical protein
MVRNFFRLAGFYSWLDALDFLKGKPSTKSNSVLRLSFFIHTSHEFRDNDP